MTAKRPRDANQLAKRVLDIATGESDDPKGPPEKDPEAVKRGKARAEKLTPEQRRQIAKKAAETRWRA